MNSTGTEDAVDAALLLFQIAGIVPNVANLTSADVDSNGRLDSIDVLQILQVIAGLISHNALSCR